MSSSLTGRATSSCYLFSVTSVDTPFRSFRTQIGRSIRMNVQIFTFSVTTLTIQVPRWFASITSSTAFSDCRSTAQRQADSVIASVIAIFQQRPLASRLLWGKGITARPFLHAFRIQVNGVATIFFISDEQRGPGELQVADKQPLVVLFTLPELDSSVKNLHLPQ